MMKLTQCKLTRLPAALRHHRSQRSANRARTVFAQAEASEAGSPGSQDAFSLAPSAPATPYGEMMAYYLKMEPALFESAVDDQFNKIKEQRDEAQKALADEQAESAKEPATTASTDLVLSGLQNRVQGLAEKERQATVEDLMYLSILRQFMKLNVDMLPKMDNYKSLDAITLDPLMGGVHSKEALELVREHMMNLLGQTQMMPPQASLKMSKLQMVQVYGASVMFGYFLRRADSRFQLAKRTGMLPEDREEAVARLERLFAMADTDDDNPDTASPPPGSQESEEPSAFDTSTEQPKANEHGDKALRKYIESFDQQTMRETATIMTREGASLLDRQTKALWGDASELQSEMQKAIGLDVTTMEEVMKRAEKAVANDDVATVTMSIGTQRRAVLEAVAFGTFLRDVESDVDTSYGLLTPLPVGKGPDSPPGPGSDGSDPPGMLPA